MKSALITGIAGQDGSYLAELLIESGYQVTGIEFSSATQHPTMHEQDHLCVDIHYVDASDHESLEQILAETKPAEIYDLARLSPGQSKWSENQSTYPTSPFGTSRLIDFARSRCPNARIVHASNCSILRDCSCEPLLDRWERPTPEVVESMRLHRSAITSRERYRMFVSTAILYPRESPRNSMESLGRRITAAAAQAALGQRCNITLPNLPSRFDWTFAKDHSRGLRQILLAPAPADFLLASGESHTLTEFAQAAFDFVGLDSRKYVTWSPVAPHHDEIKPSSTAVSNAYLTFPNLPQVTFREMVQLMVNEEIQTCRRSLRGRHRRVAA